MLIKQTMKILAGIACLAVGATSVQAQSAAEFYKGKTLNLVVSSSAGGGYDVLARTIGRHLPKHIPGLSVVNVRNMPGAGGIVATNFIYNLAPKDGLTIGGVQNNTPFEPLLGTKEAEYDPKKFNWLGSPSFETGLLIAWHTVPVSTVDEARKKEMTVSSSGANSTPSFYARLLNELLALLKRPQIDRYDLDWGVWVVLLDSCITAAPIADHGYDLQLGHWDLFNLLNQPCVDVELVLPVNLLVHDRPSRTGLVVVDSDRAVFVDDL